MGLNGLLDGAKNVFNKAKNVFNKAKNFAQEKLPKISEKPDIVIKPDDDFLQAMGKLLNSVKIQFKEMGSRISDAVKKDGRKLCLRHRYACVFLV
jgi:hypothetical protein